MRIGERLRAARNASGMSLTDLASATHLSKGFISQVERGLSNPSLESLIKITAALGISPGVLLAEEPAVRTSRTSFVAPGDRETGGIDVFSSAPGDGGGLVLVPMGESGGLAILLKLAAYGSVAAPEPSAAAEGIAHCAVLLGAVRITQGALVAVVRQGEVAAFDHRAAYSVAAISAHGATLFLSLPGGCILPTLMDVAAQKWHLSLQAPATGPFRLVEMRATRAAWAANEGLRTED